MTPRTASAQDEVQGFFAGRLPDGWFQGPPDVEVDDDEILVVGTLDEPDVPEGASPDTARVARIKRFREETREARMAIADEAQRLFGRTVSWGASVGGVRRLFTTLNVPVMTRLRIPERTVLDTLVQGGVARSRSEALAWCVRLVGQHQADWIADLQDALTHVEKVRAEGPTSL
ncbi:MAG: hypothetical protein QOJ09_529 [Actinomycetota bacterium]|jgi:hypothetical protein|nr:hypothetical protein [Actinomycetota bacterium]